MTLPDIPRLYTALAEWCACLIYVLPLRGRLRGWRFWLTAAGALAIQGAFLGLTGGLPLPFWIPCMAAAVGLMFLFLWLCGGAAAGLLGNGSGKGKRKKRRKR